MSIGVKSGSSAMDRATVMNIVDGVTAMCVFVLTATVVATSPMRLIVMFQREFREMEREMPAVADRIRAAIRARLDAA